MALAALLSVAAGACSSSSRRDQNYGKDAGTTYEPAEAGMLPPDSSRAERDRNDGGAQDASAESAGDATIDGETDADR
jgi:hypothetical protein